MGTSITVNHICKVEGHASLVLEIERGRVKRCELRAIEGARFFEGILVGRPWDEAKEITSRICGICSVVHSMTSLKAMEAALGVEPSRQTRLLREVMMIGERIRSHATHLYFLALPDYLGYESALAMAPKYPEEVKRALALVKLGNEIVIALGARQMHPVSSVPGGFTHVPSDRTMNGLLDRLKLARKDCVETLRLFASLPYPQLENPTEHLSLGKSDLGPLLDGKVVTDQGLNIEPKDYVKHIEERIEPYATSKFAVREGKGYMVGALSRLINNPEAVTAEISRVMDKEGFHLQTQNPFHNNVAQAIELVHWTDVAVRLLDGASFTPEKPVEARPKEGRGVAAGEAPRGILFHDYTTGKDGRVTRCNIITPTCQNLRNMESDIRAYVQQLLAERKGKGAIVLEIEKLIRAYDPCFSCSTHFLKVDWKGR
ncbi:Ni/Fe hydrogenase subunit alpha [Candidatus Woesearchaeota archaeon]|nr:Ni/Fe hydrogenase subunit alpha [Candidatus Woesearchaeota archaeon]